MFATKPRNAFVFKPDYLMTGPKLAKALSKHVAPDDVVRSICSRIVIRSALYACYLVEDCNGDQRQNFTDDDTWRMVLNLQTVALEKEIAILVNRLANLGGIKMTVNLGGDPRGCTVVLNLPDGTTIGVA